MIVSTCREISQIWPPMDIQVQLNGVVQSKCIYADDVKGIILRHSCDFEGNIHVLVGKTNGPLIVEQRYGKVEIIHMRTRYV